MVASMIKEQASRTTTGAMDLQGNINLLLDAWRKGDERSADAIYHLVREQVEQTVRTTLHRCVVSRVDVEDVVQQVFLAAFARLAKDHRPFESGVAFTCWMARFAEFHALKRTRYETAAKRTVKREVSASGECIDVHHDVGQRPEMTSPLQQMIYSETVSRLARQLDARDRAILKLLVDGHSQVEIARQLSISERQVRRRVRAIRDAYPAARGSLSDSSGPGIAQHAHADACPTLRRVQEIDDQQGVERRHKPIAVHVQRAGITV